MAITRSTPRASAQRLHILTTAPVQQGRLHVNENDPHANLATLPPHTELSRRLSTNASPKHQQGDAIRLPATQSLRPLTRARLWEGCVSTLVRPLTRRTPAPRGCVEGWGLGLPSKASEVWDNRPNAPGKDRKSELAAFARNWSKSPVAEAPTAEISIEFGRIWLEPTDVLRADVGQVWAMQSALRGGVGTPRPGQMHAKALT